MSKGQVETDSTKRFSTRAGYYHRSRPAYPGEVVRHLRSVGFVTAEAVVADVGSGTGLLARTFLEAGHTVYAVEPNEAMRLVASDDLARHKQFHPVAGTAEGGPREVFAAASELSLEVVELLACGYKSTSTCYDTNIELDNSIML